MKAILKNYTVVISENVFNILNQFIQKGRQKYESGGILLGQVKEKTVYITKLSVPNHLDKAKKTYFERHKLPAQLIINHEFYNSDGKTIYLGEWHTHPELIPSPSSVDIEMLKQQFIKNTLNIDCIFLLIQGINELYVGEFDGSKITSRTVKKMS